MNPKQALQRVRIAMEDESLSKIIRVAGIAGPGEPLANDATFETFGLIEKEYPHLIKCVSTNGLLLPDRLDEMLAVNVHSLTITINALDPEVGARIYSNINYRGEPVTGEDGVRLLINNQLEGLAAATRHGILTKVNTVLIPGINDDQITLIAHKVKELGAYVMNIMPVIPQADFAGIKPPTAMQLQEARDANEDIIVQFRHCSQCRADAIGLIGDKQSGGCQ
jgi:nitrogen fixation protein NifB